MSKRHAAKYKIDRRMGENIWARNKSPVAKRAYGPGQHGQRKSRKLSDYGTQLRAKQKLKGYYGNITERQFRRYYQEASRKPGDTGETMIGLLERRLDAVIFRAKFAPTPFSARQLVSHGHVLVNGKRVTVPSYLVKVGDATGTVESLSVRTIRLRSEDGSIHVIPFSAVNTVTNMTRDFSRAVGQVVVTYEADYDRAIAALKAVGAELRADAHWGTVTLDELEVYGLDRLDDLGVVIRFRIKCNAFGRWSVARELNRRAKERFDADGIELSRMKR